MELNYIFLCDHAHQTGDKKVHALGIGICRFFAQNLPYVHSHFSLVCSLRYTVTEVGTKKVTVSVLEADGDPVMPPIESDVPFQKPEGSLTGSLNITMAFRNVLFKEYGDYSIRVAVAGHEEASVDITIVPPPEPPQTAP